MVGNRVGYICKVRTKREQH